MSTATLSCGCRIQADRRVHGGEKIGTKRRSELEKFHAEIHAIQRRHHEQELERRTMPATGCL